MSRTGPQEVVAVVDDGIAGVAAAYEGTLDAVAPRESKSTDVQAEAENRPLPEQPVV